MSDTITNRLAELGITLPDAPAPAANYIPFVKTGNLVFISGQVPLVNGAIELTGKVGDTVTIEQAQQQARICAINILAQAKVAAEGDLSKIKRIVKLGGFVACRDDFTSQPEVINGASDLMADIFGEAGQHARFAVGTNALPRGVVVEIDAVIELH
ncbi:MAG: RidA family protein [Candidatus Puniceispirillaceae bacterium]